MWGPTLRPGEVPRLPGLTAAGGFGVDTTAVATPVAKLEEAIQRLNQAILRMERRQGVPPPADDHVSSRMADNHRIMMGNAAAYVRALRDRVRAARDALREQIDSYAAADDPRVFRS